jgi:hypothetical protein
MLFTIVQAMIAELNASNLSVPTVYMTAVQQYVPTLEFAQHYQHLQQLLQMRQMELQHWVQHQQQQQQQQQLTLTSQLYSASSVNSDKYDDADAATATDAAATAATYNSPTEGLALYADSNNMFNDRPTFGTSRSCQHTLMSNHTAAAAAGAQDSLTAFTAADDIDDAWSTAIDPVLQSLWGTS